VGYYRRKKSDWGFQNKAKGKIAQIYPSANPGGGFSKNIPEKQQRKGTKKEEKKKRVEQKIDTRLSTHLKQKG